MVVLLVSVYKLSLRLCIQPFSLLFGEVVLKRNEEHMFMLCGNITFSRSAYENK